MRISDWSSDVCSSDLRVVFTLPRLDPATARDRIPSWPLLQLVGGPRQPGAAAITVEEFASHPLVDWLPQIGRASCRGKSVSVRVDLGGLRIIKKKKKSYT